MDFDSFFLPLGEIKRKEEKRCGVASPGCRLGGFEGRPLGQKDSSAEPEEAKPRERKKWSFIEKDGRGKKESKKIKMDYLKLGLSSFLQSFFH